LRKYSLEKRRGQRHGQLKSLAPAGLAAAGLQDLDGLPDRQVHLAHHGQAALLPGASQEAEEVLVAVVAVAHGNIPHLQVKILPFISRA
jgi:hypothetical protein